MSRGTAMAALFLAMLTAGPAPDARADAAAPIAAGAMAVGFVAALFGHNCAYVSHMAAFPALMGTGIARSVNDIIPADACDADAADADPLQVLADHDLFPKRYTVEQYGAWTVRQSPSAFAPVSPQQDDTVVTLYFEDDRGAVSHATVLIVNRNGDPKITGYIE